MIDKGLRVRKGFFSAGQAQGDDISPGTSTSGGQRGGFSDARDKAMGLQGKTGRVDKSLTTGGGFDKVDRSKVSQFSQYGKNRMAQSLNPNLRFDPRSGTMKNRFAPSMIFGGLLSLITGIPGVGLALGGLKTGLGFLGDKLQDLRGYNEDGSPRTQAEYEAARQQRQLQNRLDNLDDRKSKGKSFSQTNIDMLEAMGLQPSTAQNVLTGRDLKGFTESRMGLTNPDVIETFANPIAPMGVNVPSTGIQTIDVNLPGNDLMAFAPNSKLDRTLKNLYSGYENLGIQSPQMIELMKQDLLENKEKGTPLSLPADAYTLVG